MQQEGRYPVIGLTGGVGAGKSTVLSFLQENYGFYVIQADLMARKLMEPGKEAYKAVCDFLGPVILQENGEIDRKIMADIIFNDPAKIATHIINAIDCQQQPFLEWALPKGTLV